MARKLGKGGRGGKVAVLSALVPLSPLRIHAPAAAPGWSGDGHRVVCSLAWNRLTGDARAGIRALLGPALDAEGFADACMAGVRLAARLNRIFDRDG